MPLDGTYYETKPDVFSVEGFVAWLRTQDPAARYDYQNCNGGCLIGRYLVAVTGKMWRDHGLSWGDISRDYPVLNRIAVKEPWTYGAALERALAYGD